MMAVTRQCEECGSPYDRGCGAKFHDTAPPAPEGFDPIEHVRSVVDSGQDERVIAEVRAAVVASQNQPPIERLKDRPTPTLSTAKGRRSRLTAADWAIIRTALHYYEASARADEFGYDEDESEAENAAIESALRKVRERLT